MWPDAPGNGEPRVVHAAFPVRLEGSPTPLQGASGIPGTTRTVSLRAHCQRADRAEGRPHRRPARRCAHRPRLALDCAPSPADAPLANQPRNTLRLAGVRHTRLIEVLGPEHMMADR